MTLPGDRNPSLAGARSVYHESSTSSCNLLIINAVIAMGWKMKECLAIAVSLREANQEEAVKNFATCNI